MNDKTTKTDNDIISREAAIRACKEWMDRIGINDGLYRAGLIISLKYLSPANRLHAKWVRDDDLPVCSHCGKEDIISQDGGGCFYEPPYCMWCGAKMDDD